jgi:hypothetical protein
VLSLSSFRQAWGSSDFCWWNSWSINAGQQMLFANLCIRPFSHKNCKLLTFPKLDWQSRTQERQIMQQHMATNFQQYTKFRPKQLQHNYKLALSVCPCQTRQYRQTRLTNRI